MNNNGMIQKNNAAVGGQTVSTGSVKKVAINVRDLENGKDLSEEIAGPVKIKGTSKTDGLNIARLDSTPKDIESEVLNIIPREVAEKYKIIAFERNGNLIKVAIVDPQDINALNALRFVAEKESVEMEVYLADEKVFNEMLGFFSGPVGISRIKILSNLKIDEKRKPQDGRFRLSVKDKEIDFRVSSLPVIEGEKMVMRILDKEGGVAQVEHLGLLGTALDNLKAATQETYGMVLITGPTGSGKSTTLYAFLKILNNEERNIITLEDPVEYYIEGINQSQIKPEIGYTFASGLRTILRQDPNVIMVGEIRDSETAELAVHAALTGHLMFSTLHTNTAIGGIPRLIDMGIEPFLLASSLRIVVAQRLVRKICDKCKEEKKVPESVRKAIEKGIADVCEDELKKYGVDRKEEIKFYHGKGCDACNGTGLRGRLAIYEAVPVNENIKNIIIEKRGNEEMIDKERIDLGVLTIKQDGILKIIKGLTTIEEIDRVTEGNMALEEEND